MSPSHPTIPSPPGIGHAHFFVASLQKCHIDIANAMVLTVDVTSGFIGAIRKCCRSYLWLRYRWLSYSGFDIFSSDIFQPTEPSPCCIHCGRLQTDCNVFVVLFPLLFYAIKTQILSCVIKLWLYSIVHIAMFNWPLNSQ